jgi:hypothetical protein
LIGVDLDDVKLDEVVAAAGGVVVGAVWWAEVCADE